MKNRILVSQRSTLPQQGGSELHHRARHLIIVLVTTCVFIAAFYLGWRQLLGNGQQLESYTLPYPQNFEDVDPKQWLTENGVWQIRNQALVQIVNLERISNLFIPKKLATDQLYHLSVYIKIPQNGRAAGVYFNAQYPQLTKATHEVYIERTSSTNEQSGAEDPMQLVAGYTNENGGFVPQVAVPLTVDSHTYRLDLYVLGGTYTVQLNGQSLIERRPLFYTGGLIGFYTQGAATFDTLKLTTADPSQPGEMFYMSDFDKTPGAAGWVPFGDDWAVLQGELVQTNQSVQESGIGYEGSSFENFALRVTLHHLTGSGGGILFNMPSPYQLNGAQVVRFSDQSDALFWGYYDEQGNFARQGFSAVSPPGNQLHYLRVLSGESTYQIYLDDQLIASDIPLMRTSGHIGLVTARSSVAYSEVDLFPLFGNDPLPALKADATLEQVAIQSMVTSTLPATEVASSYNQTITPTPNPASAKLPIVTLATATIAAGTIGQVMQQTSVAITNDSVLLPTVTPTPGQSSLISDGTTVRNDEESTILALLPPATPSAVLTPSESHFGTGKWLFKEGTYTQVLPEPADYILNTGIYASEYTAEALIALPTKPDSSGGLIFHMPDPLRRSGAFMVCIIRGGESLSWGSFDESGTFLDHASVELPQTEDSLYRLVLHIAGNRLSITIDDQEIAKDILLPRSEGWMGLFAFGGMISFSDVKITVGVLP